MVTDIKLAYLKELRVDDREDLNINYIFEAVISQEHPKRKYPRVPMLLGSLFRTCLQADLIVLNTIIFTFSLIIE